MAHRLTKIYTRTGDDGTTGLADGSRIAKDDPRVEAMGGVDELNSFVGLLLAEDLPPGVRDTLSGVQHDLFDLGGELAKPGHAIMSAAHSARLESALDAFNAQLPPLKDFILPGGSHAAAIAHVARAVCRRAERTLVACSKSDPLPPAMLQYLNRLSDLLFVLARVLNRQAGGNDVYWQLGRNRGD
jgi:cob(I)alamin adenosyltransferase